METFLVTLYKKRYSLFGCALVLPVLLLAATRIRIAATDAQIKNMLNILEAFYPFFASLFVCCIIPRMTEAELIVLSGGSLTLTALYEFAAYLAIALVTVLILVVQILGRTETAPAECVVGGSATASGAPVAGLETAFKAPVAAVRELNLEDVFFEFVLMLGREGIIQIVVQAEFTFNLLK